MFEQLLALRLNNYDVKRTIMWKVRLRGIAGAATLWPAVSRPTRCSFFFSPHGLLLPSFCANSLPLPPPKHQERELFNGGSVNSPSTENTMELVKVQKRLDQAIAKVRGSRLPLLLKRCNLQLTSLFHRPTNPVQAHEWSGEYHAIQAHASFLEGTCEARRREVRAVHAHPCAWGVAACCTGQCSMAACHATKP